MELQNVDVYQLQSILQEGVRGRKRLVLLEKRHLLANALVRDDESFKRFVVCTCSLRILIVAHKSPAG